MVRLDYGIDDVGHIPHVVTSYCDHGAIESDSSGSTVVGFVGYKPKSTIFKFLLNPCTTLHYQLPITPPVER